MGVDEGCDVDRPQGLGERSVAPLERSVLMEQLLELSLFERIEGSASTATTDLVGDLGTHGIDVDSSVAHRTFLTIGPPAVSDAESGRFNRPAARPW